MTAINNSFEKYIPHSVEGKAENYTLQCQIHVRVEDIQNINQMVKKLCDKAIRNTEIKYICDEFYDAFDFFGHVPNGKLTNDNIKEIHKDAIIDAVFKTEMERTFRVICVVHNDKNNFFYFPHSIILRDAIERIQRTTLHGGPFNIKDITENEQNLDKYLGELIPYDSNNKNACICIAEADLR